MLQCWQYCVSVYVYMCYIWFCSVINFVWKKCKNFDVFRQKTKTMAEWHFDRLLLFRTTASSTRSCFQYFNLATALVVFLLCIHHCHGKNPRFSFFTYGIFPNNIFNVKCVQKIKHYHFFAFSFVPISYVRQWMFSVQAVSYILSWCFSFQRFKILSFWWNQIPFHSLYMAGCYKLVNEISYIITN